MIKFENGVQKYFDRNGKEIKPGDKVKYPDGKIETVHLIRKSEYNVENDKLGIPISHCADLDLGYYAFTESDTNNIEIVSED